MGLTTSPANVENVTWTAEAECTAEQVLYITNMFVVTRSIARSVLDQLVVLPFVHPTTNHNSLETSFDAMTTVFSSSRQLQFQKIVSFPNKQTGRGVKENVDLIRKSTWSLGLNPARGL